MRFIDIRSHDVQGLPLIIDNLSEARFSHAVFGILKENVLCSIATVTPVNRAYINTAYFCFSDDLELYFLSHPRSMHCRNLTLNPSAGVTIFSSSQTWTNPGRGLQVFGTCHKTRGKDAFKAVELYGKRFPAYKRWKTTLPTGDVGENYHLYRVLTSSVKLHDEKMFGDGVFVVANVE